MNEYGHTTVSRLNEKKIRKYLPVSFYDVNFKLRLISRYFVINSRTVLMKDATNAPACDDTALKLCKSLFKIEWQPENLFSISLTN